MPGVHQRLERTRGAAGCHVRAAVTAGRSTAGREVPWSERSSMDPATILKIGNPYTRDKIHKLLGGDKQSYLPHVGGRIRRGCFDPALNKAAPIEIDVGKANPRLAPEVSLPQRTSLCLGSSCRGTPAISLNV